MDSLTGTISTLFVYPIKSCAAVPLNLSKLTEFGLETDRRWVIVDDQGIFQTQRQIPHLVWIEPQIDIAAQTMRLSAPSQPDLLIPWATIASAQQRITVWRDSVMALDMGEAAAQWLDNYLQVPGRHFRLMQFNPEHPRLSDTAWTGQQTPPCPHPFTDGFALNVLSQRAVDELNIRLEAAGIEPVNVLRFRPNLVLEDIPAHEEDHMQSLWINTPQGTIELELVKPCTRCVVPEIDPYTAIREPGLLHVLAQYRQNTAMNHAICFGVNAVVRAGAGLSLEPGPFEYQLRF